MRLLITGACGLLGAHLMALLSKQHEVMGVDRNPWWGDRPVHLVQMDLLEPGGLEDLMCRTRPETVIHCAAWADVDSCERDPEYADRCNVGMTRRIAEALSPEVRLVYISTDGVFEGNRPFAREEWPPKPRTVYGRTKWKGELEVSRSAKNHLILRTNFYGWSSGRKKTSAEWLYHTLESGTEVTLFDDFFFTPLYVVDFAVRLGRLLEGGHRGLFHVGGKDRVSKYQFGAFMAGLAGFSMKAVGRGSIDQAGLLAPRPKDMSLDSGFFLRATGMEPLGGREGLRAFLTHRQVPLSERFTEPHQRTSTPQPAVGASGNLPV